jgi:hypothetical protein
VLRSPFFGGGNFALEMEMIVGTVGVRSMYKLLAGVWTQRNCDPTICARLTLLSNMLA